MLKHTTSGGSSEKGSIKQITSSRIATSYDTYNDSQNRLRYPSSTAAAAAEPEYQNTRNSPINGQFYRNKNLSKSIRSVDNLDKRIEWNSSRYRAANNNDTLQNHYTHHNINNSSCITQHNKSNQRLNQSDVFTISGNLPPNGHVPSSSSSSKIIIANGGLNISKTQQIPSTLNILQPIENIGRKHYDETSCSDNNNNNNYNNNIFSNGIKEILTSLGLLCLISLLLALLSLIFLLKISPVTATDMKDLLRAEQFTIISPDEYVTVYEVTLALCALSLSLNLCCLLVCSVQFLFAVKLARTSTNGDRTNKYLQKSSVTRVCAIAGFFISIPVFLTGVILYTFIQFHSTPAIITSVLIGSGIVFCGCAMVHNVFVWQKEKTNAVRAIIRREKLGVNKERNGSNCATNRDTSATALSSVSTLHPTAADLSSTNTTPHELSTLV